MSDEHISRENITEGLERVIEHGVPNTMGTHSITAEAALEVIRDIPAADVVEVVRCCDCENWDTDWVPSHAGKGQYFCPILGQVTDTDFYCGCGCGKRKDAEEQGRLVILPCKVGDKVRDKIADHIFTIQTVELGHKAGTLFRCGNPGTDDYAAFYDFEIGERFDILGHEEAEAALKGGQDDGD